MKADFAIGITTRDRWSELGRTLDQIARCGLTDRETLVIDDGSITPVPPDLRARHPWVRFERSDTSLGYIAQRNDLAQRLTAPFYLSLDDDSYPVGGDLAVAAQWLAAHREVIALAFCVTESAAVPPGTDSGKPFPVRYYIGCAHLLRREDFLSFLEREPKVAIKIIMLLCQRIRWQSERMEESMLQPLPVRLARRLCALAADFGSEVHISQEQLGVFVGAARESVNRQLQLWRKDGILDLQRGRILLQNLNKLTAVARNE